MIKVIIELDAFDCNGMLIDEADYIKYYKEDGWLYNKEAEAIYYEAELHYMPQEGQRLSTKIGISIVKYAIYEVDEQKNASYFNRTRIVVDNE